jgi:hypothetical protein
MEKLILRSEQALLQSAACNGAALDLMQEWAMNTKIASARALVRNTDISVPERRRRLNQFTTDVRRDYDERILGIRTEIAALGTTTLRALWQTIVGVVIRVPFRRAVGTAAIAKLRIQLAEVHTAKFAAMAELKVLKAFT